MRLTEIFRQAESSRIIVNAHRIKRGEMPIADRDPASDFHLILADLTGAVAGEGEWHLVRMRAQEWEWNDIGRPLCL